MRYFLVRPNNQLQYLPDFRLVRTEPALRPGDTNGELRVVHHRKNQDHFVCAYPGGDLPAPFLVVDEHAHVFDLAGKVTKTVGSTLIVSGVVLCEYEAPYQAEAREAVAEAIKVISE